MLKKEREQILTGLRGHRGAQAEVVRRTCRIKDGGFSRNYVFQVLSGDRTNLEILNVAVDVLKERNDRIQTLSSSLTRKVAQLQAV